MVWYMQMWICSKLTCSIRAAIYHYPSDAPQINIKSRLTCFYPKYAGFGNLQSFNMEAVCKGMQEYYAKFPAFKNSMGPMEETLRASTKASASVSVNAPPHFAITAEATLAPHLPMLQGSMPVSQP